MGDENSLAGSTKAHKHSALASDGGFLETTVTGVTNLSEGSIVYGDASEIVTELSAGSDGDSLQVSSGLPVWSSAGGGKYSYVGTTDTLVTAPNGYDGLHLSFSAVDMTAVTELVAIVTAKRDTNSLGFLWNGVTSGYKYGGYVTTTAGSGTAFGGSGQSLFEIGHHSVGTVQSLVIHITLNENDDKFNVSGTAGGNDGGSFAGGGDNNVSTTCDSISFVESGGNMPAGNHRLTVYKVER
jgi:hypothetical protein